MVVARLLVVRSVAVVARLNDRLGGDCGSARFGGDVGGVDICFGIDG